MEKKLFSLNKNEIILHDNVTVLDEFFKLNSNGMIINSLSKDIYDDRCAYIDSQGRFHAKGTQVDIPDPVPIPPSSDYENGSIDSATGEIKDSETSVRTVDFITASSSYKYTVKLSDVVVYFKFSFYDSNKRYISCTDDATVTTGFITTIPPSGTAYMKFKFSSEDLVQANALAIAQNIKIVIEKANDGSIVDPGEEDPGDPNPTDPNGIVEAGSIDTNTGKETDSTTSVRSVEYIAISDSYTYTLNFSGTVSYFRFQFYDANKNFLGVTDDGTVKNTVTATPISGAKYMRFKFTASDNKQATGMTIGSSITITKTKIETPTTPTPSPGTSDPGTGDMLYRFGMLADTHIDGDGNDESYSASDIKNAMSFLMAQNVSFICIAGDVSRNGTSKDYDLVKKYLGSSYNTKNVPVYCVTGNHDCMEKGTSGFKSATGCELNYVKQINGDVFIFASMSAEKAATSSCYSSSTASWVKTQLSTYKNKRKFFITHPFIQGTCGNNGNSYHDSLTNSGNNKIIIDAIKADTKLIHVSGHSHFLFEVTNSYANNNYYYKSGGPHYIHVPSNTRPRNKSATNVYEKGEGYIVDVYKDKVVFRGFDSVKKEYKTSYVYTIKLAQ